MGLMGAAMGLGMIFGPLLGGPLTQMTLSLPPALNALMQVDIDPATGAQLNFSLPFLFGSLLTLLTIPFAIFLLPESLPPDKRTIEAAGGPSRLSLLAEALRGPMAFLFVTAFLLAFALACFEGILGLFGKDRFGMSPSELGFMMGLMGVLSVIQQMVVIGPLTKWIGEERVLQAGLVISVLGLVGLAVAPLKWEMIALAVVFNVGNSLLRPSVASLISQRAQTGQGVALGLENSFMSLGRATGPIWGGFTYDVNYAYPFWSAAFIQAAALVISFWLMPEPGGKPAVAAAPAQVDGAVG
jgi:DHA1 family multidrug resistance protein-like MFS transporter